MKKLQIILPLIVLLLFLASAYIFMDLLFYADIPTGGDPVKKVVLVHPGQGFAVTTLKLQEMGIIHSPLKFKLLALIKRQDKRVKAGEYLFSSAMTPNHILNTLVSGKVQLHRFTVPEGYNLSQVASVVAIAGFGTETDFLKAAYDPRLAKQLEIDGEPFEGYLFPDTYYFPKGETPEKIISTMVKRFWIVFKPLWKDRADQSGLSIHQVVTLASIIEKETGAPSERPLISSVFHNRMKKRMRLESDPTVIYGITDFDGNLTRKHLSTKTPYNTYRIRGLPPGPIANPGAKALEAALYPAATRFLYFVSKKDRTHKFSTNIKDHNKAVRKYQLRR